MGTTVADQNCIHEKITGTINSGNACYSPDIITVIKSGMRWARHVARMGGEMKNAYKNMIGNPEGKRPLGRIRCRWRIILKCGREIELQCVEIIHLHRDRSLRWTVMITVLNHEIP